MLFLPWGLLPPLPPVFSCGTWQPWRCDKDRLRGQWSGRLPIFAINRLEELKSLMSARPAYMMTKVGAVTGQCYAAMRSGHARNRSSECPAAINGHGLVITGD